ncbi:helix-turn-helix domain-containing protein [Streptomyces hesseae]|uniref:Helix-turn-helix transcriptional regulator n=1 Tax=Streptomyces hesseae TaxID=3075519 RepID=A0ABU2SPM5_9ACTN|nr:helix-turn-helix transcriptional regulator [Streptomyces sp. DSM 40473]MDT0450943.1 helix-turn-helix transcriptional regulator [Streptomyces sp. DSM 40473]
MPARKSTSGRKPSARRTLAEELARLREESGRSLSELAEETTYDRAYLHKLEKGDRLGSPEVMQALDQVYGTDKHLSLLWELATEDVIADKYKRFMALESEATSRYEFSVSTVPGLLQTEDYAREVLRAASSRGLEELEEQVVARLARQEWLFREDLPVYRAILDEAVLMRAPKGPKAWQAQLTHLLDVAAMPNVTLQVLPFSAGLHGLVGTSLTLLWLPGGKTVAYTEDAFAGELTEYPEPVERMRLVYDLVRDDALSPRESVAFVKQVAEDSLRCNPSE